MQLILASLLVCGAIEFHDVLEAPPAVLDAAEATLWEMMDEIGLRSRVVDMVVVGSFGYGMARLDGDDPSDIDIIVYLRGFDPKKTRHLEGYESFRRAAERYESIVQRRLGSQLKVDIKADLRDVRTHIADPDWSGYSLLARQAYNRPDGKPRALHGQFYDDVYYVFERAAYQAYVAELKRRPRGMSFRVDGDQLVIYDRDALERGEPGELLRSLHKRSAKAKP